MKFASRRLTYYGGCKSDFVCILDSKKVLIVCTVDVDGVFVWVVSFCCGVDFFWVVVCLRFLFLVRFRCLFIACLARLAFPVVEKHSAIDVVLSSVRRSVRRSAAVVRGAIRDTHSLRFFVGC